MPAKKKEQNPTTLVNARENDYTIGIFYGSNTPTLSLHGAESTSKGMFQDRILDMLAFEKGFAEWFCSLIGEVLGCRCVDGDGDHKDNCHGVWLIRTIERCRGHDPKEISKALRTRTNKHSTYAKARAAWNKTTEVEVDLADLLPF